MKSLNEIKTSQFEDLSLNLEKSIFNFLNNKSFQLLNISNEEISEGLDLYGEELIDFWPTLFNFNNIESFLVKTYLKDLILEWVFEQPDFNKIDGKINLKTLTLTAEPKIGLILSKVQPKVLDEEVSKLINNLSDLDESIDKEVDVSLIKGNQVFELKLKQENESRRSNLKKCIDLASMSIVIAVMFSSSFAQADDTKKAISHASKAAMEQSGLGRQLDEVQKNLEKQGRQIIQDIGGEVPAAVIGTGAKVAIDRRVDFKGKVKVIPVNYEVSVGLDESKVKIGNDDLFDAKVEGWISGTTGNSTQKLEIGLRYDF